MATLIGIKLLDEPFIQRFAHQATKVLDAEPGLMILDEGVEKAIVASEDGGGEAGMCFRWIWCVVKHVSAPC